NLPQAIVPQVDDGPLTRNGLRVATQEFEGLGRLNRRHQLDGRREDSGRVARRAGPRGWWLGEETSQARRFARDDGHRLPLGADRPAVNPRLAGGEGKVVEQESDLEVV